MGVDKISGKYKALRRNGKRIDEHRLLMERILNRKLSFNEVVHHINGDKSDNRVENLQVMTRSEHARLHTKGRKEKPETIEAKRKRSLGKTRIDLRKLSADDESYIKEHYIPRDKEFGYRALARKFGVHHETIRRIVIGRENRKN